MAVPDDHRLGLNAISHITEHLQSPGVERVDRVGGTVKDPLRLGTLVVPYARLGKGGFRHHFDGGS